MVYGEVSMSLKKISAWHLMTPLVKRLKFIQFREISLYCYFIIISTSSIPSLSNFHCVEMESSGIIPILYIFPLTLTSFCILGNVLIVIFYNSVLSFSSVFIQIFIYLGYYFFKKRECAPWFWTFVLCSNNYSQFFTSTFLGAIFLRSSYILLPTP